MSQTITVPTIGTATGFTATQSYTYDPLNRLQSMSETGGLSQTFDYDRYGNRIITAGFVQNTTQTPNTIQNNTTLADWYDQSTNKLKTANYDAVGNVIKDTAGTNQGNTFDYDAENKQVRYDNGSVSGGADYQYDGDGHRVKKVVGTGQAATIYVYDAMGQMVAEYANQSSGSGTSYLTSDSLGTPRVITDSSGSVKARHDYLPFGEELAAGVGRMTSQGYNGNADGNRKRWAQLERDDETGLDYAQARYYANAQGRFTSPDPLLSSGKPLQPQSWNRYSYCLNNPLILVDPTGLIWIYQDRDHNERGWRWVAGKSVPKGMYKDGWRAWTGSNLVNLPNGDVLELGKGPHATIYHNAFRDFKTDSASQTRINAAAGLFDSGVPLGREIREGLGLSGGADTTSTEYKNAGNAALIATIFIPGLGEGKLSEEAIGLGKQLASESQLAELLNGEGKVIAGPGTAKAVKQAERLAKEYGGNAQDWQKVIEREGSRFTAADGQVIQTHAFQNRVIGKIVEIKSKLSD